MERVQYSLERTLPQLRILDEHRILTKDELRSVTIQRQEFEARLIRRKADKTDFVRYLEFEDDLHALVTLRARERHRLAVERSKAGDEDAKAQLLPRSFFPKQAASSSAQCVAILERMVRKFRFDVDAWERYIAWAKRRKMRVVAGRVYARALALHPMQPALWLSAADYELNTHADPSAARALLQRGIRTNKLTDTAALSAESVKAQKTGRGARALRDPGALRWHVSPYEQDVLRMWVEYMRMELVFIERLRRRWRVLGMESDVEPREQGAEAAAQSVALDDESDEDEETAAAEAEVDADVPQEETDTQPAPKAGIRPAAGMVIPPGHQQIMSGAIPLVLLRSASDSIPRALLLYVYVALLQLLSSFPFYDSVVVKQNGDVVSLRTSDGVQGLGDRLRARLMHGVLDACAQTSEAWCDAGQLGAHVARCLHPLYHAMSHDVCAKMGVSILPPSQAENELETNAMLHGASQLHTTYSPALDPLYTYAEIPSELRQGTATGTCDVWLACRPTYFLLEVVSHRLVTPLAQKVEDDDSVASSEASGHGLQSTPTPTPYLNLLANGDLPSVVQAIVAAFRKGGEAWAMPFITTLRFLGNRTRSGIHEPNLLTYIARVHTHLGKSLEHVPWVAVEALASKLEADEADAWPHIESLIQTQRMNACAWLLYVQAAQRWSREPAWQFTWAKSDHLPDEVWQPALDACTNATYLAHDAVAPVWGLLALWEASETGAGLVDATRVSPKAAREALWMAFFDWVHRAVAREVPRAEQHAAAEAWAIAMYERGVRQTGAVLASSQLVGSARESAQALHDAVVRRFVLTSDDTSTALSLAFTKSMASVSCWLEIARMLEVRVSTGALQSDAPDLVVRVLERAREQAEREGNVEMTMRAWLAFLAYLVHTQHDMRTALTQLAHATTHVRHVGGAEAAVALEQQWQALSHST